MSIWLSFSLLLSSLLPLALSTTSNIDPSCSDILTHNNTHGRLKKYIGFTSEVKDVHPDRSYTYKLGICVEADPDIKPNCGIVRYETRTLTNGTVLPPFVHCIGKITRAQVTETNDHVWVGLTYGGGDQYGTHCNNENRKGRIVFVCDPLIAGKGTVEFLEENRDDVLCYYVFMIASKQVCGSQVTAGDIILILVACLVVIWLIFMGIWFLYKRFFLGSKGFKQIPLIDFYRGFRKFKADGCDFVCRSSGSTPPSQYRPPAPPFSAETDEETDEEKDDNLLPM